MGAATASQAPVVSHPWAAAVQCTPLQRASGPTVFANKHATASHPPGRAPRHARRTPRSSGAAPPPTSAAGGGPPPCASRWFCVGACALGTRTRGPSPPLRRAACGTLVRRIALHLEHTARLIKCTALPAPRCRAAAAFPGAAHAAPRAAAAGPGLAPRPWVACRSKCHPPSRHPNPFRQLHWNPGPHSQPITGPRHAARLLSSFPPTAATSGLRPELHGRAAAALHHSTFWLDDTSCPLLGWLCPLPLAVLPGQPLG